MLELLVVLIMCLVFIVILMYFTWYQLMSCEKIKIENEILEKEIKAIKEKNYDLKSALEFEKTVSKTFSDGIEALTKKK